MSEKTLTVWHLTDGCFHYIITKEGYILAERFECDDHGWLGVTGEAEPPA